LKPSGVAIGEFEGELGEGTQLLVLVLDQWIVNVGVVEVDMVERRDEDDGMVGVAIVVDDDESREEEEEESGGDCPFKTAIPLIRCK
jgi:hypothetical protein